MTRLKRDRSVFDQLVAALRLEVVTVVDSRVNRAVTAGHEAAHAVIVDMYGSVDDVYLRDADGETYHEVALRIVGTDGAELARARESALVSLAGPASETLMLARWALAGSGSEYDFRCAWRATGREALDEPGRERRIWELFLEARQLLFPRWFWVANVAGHLLEQRRLRAGQVQRILRGVEPDRSYVFSAALRGAS